MQMMRDLDIDGELKFAKIKVQNLKMQDVDMRISAQQGVVSLKPVQLKTYGGNVAASVVIDVNSELPRYGIDQSIQGVQVGDLLKDYMGDAPISGKLSTC